MYVYVEMLIVGVWVNPWYSLGTLVHNKFIMPSMIIGVLVKPCHSHRHIGLPKCNHRSLGPCLIKSVYLSLLSFFNISGINN